MVQVRRWLASFSMSCEVGLDLEIAALDREVNAGILPDRTAWSTDPERWTDQMSGKPDASRPRPDLPNSRHDWGGDGDEAGLC